MTILDLPDAAGPTRDALILKHIVAGDAEVTWGSLVVGPITLLVMADALKLGGVRVGAGAGLAQQAADALGALLLTPKIFDLMYSSRAVTIEPETQYDATQMLTTHWFEKESATDRCCDCGSRRRRDGADCSDGRQAMDDLQRASDASWEGRELRLARSAWVGEERTMEIDSCLP